MTSKTWTQEDVAEWFSSRVPVGWFATRPVLRIDRDEILVVGELDPPSTGDTSTDDADADTVDTVDTAYEIVCSTHITEFRERTRSERMAIADEAEVLWGRKVSWGVRCDDYELRFTTQSVPVMTRLRMEEREVVDTLIAAGVARSRSEALAWCVRLVGQHQGEWIAQLREAMAAVDRVRASGPTP